jgi:hypothetical protein
MICDGFDLTARRMAARVERFALHADVKRPALFLDGGVWPPDPRDHTARALPDREPGPLSAFATACACEGGNDQELLLLQSRDYSRISPQGRRLWGVQG